MGYGWGQHDPAPAHADVSVQPRYSCGAVGGTSSQQSVGDERRQFTAASTGRLSVAALGRWIQLPRRPSRPVLPVDGRRRYVSLHIQPLCGGWLNGLVVSALGIRARGPGFDSPVAPLFHWVTTLGKLFTHTASPVSQLQETGVQKESLFGSHTAFPC